MRSAHCKMQDQLTCGGGGIPVIEQQHAYQQAFRRYRKNCRKLASDSDGDLAIILQVFDNGTEELCRIFRKAFLP